MTLPSSPDKTRHTAGPWFQDEAGICATGWGVVAQLCGPDEYFGEDLPPEAELQLQANAALIAAAPDLLTAAQGLFAAKAAFHEFERDNPNDSTKRWDAANQAIEIAEGELRSAVSLALGETP